MGFPRQGELGETAVHGHSGNCRVYAEDLEVAPAVLTLAARMMKPGDSDTVAFLQLGHAGSQTFHRSSNFMSEDDRKRHEGLEPFPVPSRHVDVTVAHATGGDTHQNLTRPRVRRWDIFQYQRGVELFQDRSFHTREPPGRLS